MYQAVRDDDWSIYSRAVEWRTIRSAYERAFAEAKKDGETQETVAERGGIRQNDLSRLFQNDKKGPQVATFVKAIKGLREGMTVSAFFAQIEGLNTAGHPVQTPAFPRQDGALAGTGGSLSAAESERIGEILVTAGMAVAQRGARIEVKRPDRSVSQARGKKSTGSPARAKNG